MNETTPTEPPVERTPHPGFVTTKISFPALDGTYTSIDVSVPYTPDQADLLAAVEQRMAQAELQVRVSRLSNGDAELNDVPLGCPPTARTDGHPGGAVPGCSPACRGHSGRGSSVGR